jgi:hypothetical protein
MKISKRSNQIIKVKLIYRLSPFKILYCSIYTNWVTNKLLFQVQILFAIIFILENINIVFVLSEHLR